VEDSDAAPGRACDACGGPLTRRAYRFPAADGWLHKCLACALRHGPLVRNGIATALVVGTVLTAINQGDVLLRGAVTGVVLVKIALTFAVPYVVSTNGALMISRVRPSARTHCRRARVRKDA
jgi:hypothetical protein